MRRSGSWGTLTLRTQMLMLALVIMLAGSAAGAARKGRRQLQQEEQVMRGDDSGCLEGFAASLNQSSTLVTWTATALRSPCKYTSTLKGITCNNSRIASISLPSSDLVGTLPDSLSACYFLQTLDLSSNSLSGPVPGDLSLLSTLSLSNNNLSGAIPYEIVTCSSLSWLDLSRNQLSGSIPPQLGLITLQFFNVSNNQLSGRIPFTLSNTSSGSPRFNASSFANNPNLYGYPLKPSSPPPLSNKKGLSPSTIVVIFFTSGLVSLTVSSYMVCFWVVWEDNCKEAARRERTEKRRNTQNRDGSDGWKEVLARL